MRFRPSTAGLPSPSAISFLGICFLCFWAVLQTSPTRQVCHLKQANGITSAREQGWSLMKNTPCETCWAFWAKRRLLTCEISVLTRLLVRSRWTEAAAPAYDHPGPPSLPCVNAAVGSPRGSGDRSEELSHQHSQRRATDTT